MYRGEFFFPCPVLSLPEPISVKEMSVGEYVSLLKFLKNNNTNDIEFYINYLIKRLVLKDSHKLNVLDKLTILLTLRSIILGSDVYLLSVSDNVRVRISIGDILNVLLSMKLSPPETLKEGNMQVELGYPRNFHVQDTDAFQNCLNSVSVGDAKLDFLNLTPTEQVAVVNRLPSILLKPMQTILLKFEKEVQSEVLFRTPSEDIRLSLYDESMIHLLKILFADDLKAIYDMAFKLISKAHFSWSDIMSLNPAEMKIFYAQLAEENKKMNKAMTTPQSPMTAIVDSLK